MDYSCIIPVYNERSRVTDVLNQITLAKNIAEVICVDDGSTDGSATIIKEKFPQVTLLIHDNNRGKTAAVATGLSVARYKNILLLDSDLRNLKSGEIDDACTCFEQHNFDCLLLNTAPMSSAERLLRPIFRCLLLAAGNRIISRQCLEESLQQVNTRGYLLEIAQNKYLMEKKKRVGYYDITATNVSKVSKRGFIKGTWQEVVMWRQIIHFAGLPFFVKHSLIFSRNKVSLKV